MASRYAPYVLDAVARSTTCGMLRMRALARRARFAAERRRFRPHPQDVFVASYPRSGTTWMLYAVHLLHRRRDDFAHLEDATPWFERMLAHGRAKASDFEQLSTPRIFKTHLLPRWTPPARVIYVERDGLDVARSYHRLYRDYLRFSGDFNAFYSRFLRGEVQYGSWRAHRAAWASAQQHRPVLTVRYERLRAEPAATLAEVAGFLRLNVEPAHVEQVVEATDISRMREHEARFDHATTMLRDLGVGARTFIGTGSITADVDGLRAQLADADSRQAALDAFLF